MEIENPKTRKFLLCRAIDFGEDCPQKAILGLDICATHKNRKEKGQEIILSEELREIEVMTCKVLLSSGLHCTRPVETDDLCTFHYNLQKNGRPLKFELSEYDILRKKRKNKKEGDIIEHCMVITRTGYCKNLVSEDYNELCTAHVNLAKKGHKLLIDIGELSPERFQRVKTPCRAIVKETGLNCIAGTIELNGICALHNNRIKSGQHVLLSDTVENIIHTSCKVYIIKNKRFCHYRAEHDGMCTKHLDIFNNNGEILCFSEHQEIDLSKYKKEAKQNLPISYLGNTVALKPIVYPKLKILNSDTYESVRNENCKEEISNSNYPEEPNSNYFEEPNSNYSEDSNYSEEPNSNYFSENLTLKCKVLTKKTNERCNEKVTHVNDELCTKHYNKALSGEKMRIDVPNNMSFSHCKVLTRNDEYCNFPLSKEGKDHSLCTKHFKLYKEGKKINVGLLTILNLKPEDFYGICNIMIKIDRRCSNFACENGICNIHNKAISNGIIHRTVEEVEKSLIYKKPHEMCKAVKQKDRENCVLPPEKEGLCNYHYGRMINGEKIETREIPLTTKKIKTGNLFIVNFPELVNEWNHNKNIGIDINSITYGSQEMIDWICPIKKHEYCAKMNARTADGNGCLTCYIESNKIINQEKLETFRNESYEKDKLKQIDKVKETYDIGDETEEYIVELLLETKKFKNVEKIGNIGGESDITITLMDDSIKQLQVKTLTPDSENVFHAAIKNYPEDMLIALVNKERTHFACIFKSETDDVKCLKLTFDYEFSKYKNKLFKNKGDFVSYLVSKIPFSTFKNNVSKTITIEKDSFERLQRYCEKFNIEYRRNTTNGNPTDIFLNGLRCQVKYASLNSTESVTYKIGSSKSGGRLFDEDKTHRTKRPYHKDDFDIFIVNVGGTKTHPDKYNDDFMFIPMNELNELGILKNDFVEGKLSFNICPPDYEKPHWSKKYWNNLSPIKNVNKERKLVLKIVG